MHPLLRKNRSKLSKIQFFQFFRIIKRNSFPEQNRLLFCKTRIFPNIYDIYPLWEKYILLKNHLESDHENCSFFSLFFSLFGCPLRLMSEIPSKFTESAWIFLCDLFMYQAFTWGHFLQIKLERKIFFLTKSQKNHLFQFWWNGGHIPYDD
jgi:hypothetical protein